MFKVHYMPLSEQSFCVGDGFLSHQILKQRGPGVLVTFHLSQAVSNVLFDQFSGRLLIVSVLRQWVIAESGLIQRHVQDVALIGFAVALVFIALPGQAVALLALLQSLHSATRHPLLVVLPDFSRVNRAYPKGVLVQAFARHLAQHIDFTVNAYLRVVAHLGGVLAPVLTGDARPYPLLDAP